MSDSAPDPSGLPHASTSASFAGDVRRVFARTEWGLLAAIVVVLLVTAFLDRDHNYFKNPQQHAINILRQTAFLGIFALGAAVVIIAGGIDLSSGSVIAFSGSLCAMLLALLAPEAVKESREIES